jgi:hypothetical protein
MKPNRRTMALQGLLAYRQALKKSLHIEKDPGLRRNLINKVWDLDNHIASLDRD